MGRPALSDEERALARERIRAGAVELFVEGGLEAITMRAVAGRAGLSASALYSYFPNRNELLRALWYEPVAAAVVQLIQVADACPDPVERIRRMIDVYLDLAAANPEVYRGAFLYVRPGSHEPPEIVSRETADFHRLLRDAITEGQKTGAIGPGDPDMMAQSVWAAIHGALALPIHLEMYDFACGLEIARSTAAMLLRGMQAASAP